MKVPVPTEEGLWWWKRDDETPEPMVVEVACLFEDALFAVMGQHGWNWGQPVEGMGGEWIKAVAPIFEPDDGAELIAGFQSTRSLMVQASDLLDNWVNSKIPGLTTIPQMMELIQRLPKEYRGVRRLYEMVHGMQDALD